MNSREAMQAAHLFWRRRLVEIEEALVGIHAGTVDRARRGSLIAAWHGVAGLLHQLEVQLNG